MVFAHGADVAEFGDAIAVAIDLDVPFAVEDAVADPGRHGSAGIAELALHGEVIDLLALQVIEALLAVVAHGGEFIDRDDAFMADDAGG